MQKTLDTKTRNLILILFLIGVFMGSLDTGIIGPVLPSIEQSFHLTSRESSWIFTLFVIFFMIGSPVMAKFSDFYGRKKIFILDVILFGIGSCLIAFSANIDSIFLGRIVQGFGCGGIFPVAGAFVGDAFPLEERGKALGILGSVFGIPLSTGTIYSMVSRCADNLTGTYNEIKTQMMVAALSHFDETGTRVEGKTWWVHVACNSLYTYLYIHKKRGKKAMEAEGVLPAFRGIAVHDCWSSYWYYNDAEHAVCNEHLLRELVGVSENHENQTWSKAFYDLLLKMNSTKDKLQRKGCMEASYYYRHKYSEEYDSLLEKAYKQNPEPEQVPGKKGRKKRGKVLALIDRLKTYKASVCLFFENFDVPFTNNMAEQAIRIIKVKTKVSGCFRKEDGAKDYLKIMSYVGTVKKQGYNVFDAILNAVKGTPYNVIPVVAAE